MNIRHGSSSDEGTPSGARQRISACRKRLRRTRATQRVLRIERDEAVLAASSLLAGGEVIADLSDLEEDFEEAEASPRGTGSQFTLPS